MSFVHERYTTIESVYESLHCFLIICNFLGLAHIRFEIVNGMPYLRHNSRLIFVTGLYVAALIWLNTSSNDRDVTIKVNYNYTVIYTVIKLIDIGNIISFVTIFAMGSTIDKRIISTINTSSEIDAVFRKLGVKVKYDTLRNYEKEILIPGIVIMLYTFILHVNHFQETISLKLEIRFLLPILIRSFFGYQYCMLFKMAQEKFKILNMEVTRFIKNTNELNFVSIQENKNLEKIKFYMHIYDKAANIVKTYNVIFAPQLIVTYSTLFIDIISALICAYDNIKANQTTESVIVWTNWIILYIVQMLVITLTCYKTTEVAESTGQIISELLTEDNLHPYVKNKLMVFVRQIQHEEVKCSPFNLFSIDTSLVFSFTRDSATYLLALFQYQENIEIQCSSKSTQ